MSGYTEASKYEVLYDLPKGEVNEKALGGVCTKTFEAGDSLEVEVYPLISVDAPAREEAARRGTSTAQKKINDKNCINRIRRMCETNFGTGDFVMHPTFDYGVIDYGFCDRTEQHRRWDELGFPRDDFEAREIMRNFIRRLKRYIARCGKDPKEFKYLYVMERTREPKDGDRDPLPPHYHYHMIISGMDCLTIEDINRIWGHGHTKAEPVDMRFNGLEGFTTYLAKRIGKLVRVNDGDMERKGRWAGSRNLKQPEETKSYRKISRRRLAKIAADVQHAGKEIFEGLYPGYRLERCEVKYSDFVAGAYIYARMRRITSGKQQQRQQRTKMDVSRTRDLST